MKSFEKPESPRGLAFMKQLRILIIGDFLPDIGGVSQYVVNMSIALSKGGHKVTILHTKSGVDTVYKGFHVYRMPLRIYCKIEVILHGLKYAYKLFRILPSMIMKPRLFLSALIIAGKIDDIIKEEKINIIHSNHLSLRSLIACLEAKEKGIPCIITAHGYDTEIPPNIMEYLIRKKCTDMADKVIVPTRLKALRLVKLYNAKNIIVIPNFILCSPLDASEALNLKLDAKRLLGYDNKNVISFVGRIVKDKGIFDIVQVAEVLKKKYPAIKDKVVFIIAGDGPDKLRLKELIIANGLTALVMYIGKVNEPLKSQLYLASDIFILPTYFSETFPIAIIEAMSHGAIPIVYRFPGVEDIYRHGSEGFILPRGDVHALSSTIENIILGKIDAHQMRLKALTRGRKYCSEHLIPCIIEIYMRMIHEKRG
jgi:glycosyltransferase involved in cell wall biosynthesis